jgi:hypothetical protein
MFVLAALCLLLGVLPGFAIDWLSPTSLQLLHAHVPAQGRLAWLSIVPIAKGRSSYNGLLVFLFIAASASVAAFAIHRFASRALRRGPAWDCGTPNSSPLTQYTAGSFAQPIRRVFGTIVFRARETVVMPPPGSVQPAQLAIEIHDPSWETIYAPLADAVDYVADRLDRLQLLTIRGYLSLVFLALVLLLLALAIWS